MDPNFISDVVIEKVSQGSLHQNQHSIKRKHDLVEEDNEVYSSNTPIYILKQRFHADPNLIKFTDDGSNGPPHDPVFSASCYIGQRCFVGRGKSKKAARQDAAHHALNYMEERDQKRKAMEPNFQPIAQPRMMQPPSISNSMSNSTLPSNLFHEDSYYDNNLNRPLTEEYNRPALRPPPIPSFELPSLDFGQPLFQRSHLPQSYLPPVARPLPQPSYHYQPAQFFPSQDSYNNLNVQNDYEREFDYYFQQRRKVDSDFSRDDFEFNSFIKFDEQNGNRQTTSFEFERKNITYSNSNRKRSKVLLRITTNEEGKQNPISLLNDLHPNAQYFELDSKEFGNFQTLFSIKLKINQMSFIGRGRTKKSAKFNAANEALYSLYNINLDNNLLESSLCVQNNEDQYMLDQGVSNAIGNFVVHKSEQVFGSNKWAVLAGIVLTDDNRPDWYDVICVTSGTKCVNAEKLSMTGSAIFDCHAEILARRCFIHYIYEQLNAYMEYGTDHDLVIERKSDLCGFKLRDNFKVNLFVSTALCGDSRVFSPLEETSTIDVHPNRASRGILRVKIEMGQGTVPVKKNSSLLTWDGILQGQQRLQFMSCSDKVAIWNSVGLQGALLSHLIEPIYLNSVSIGGLYNYEHLTRAIHGRFNLNFESDSMKKITLPFKLNKCKVSKSLVEGLETPRSVLIKYPNYAVNWIKGDEKPEVILCDTGRKLEDSQESRISKRNLFKKFRSLLGKGLSKLKYSTLGTNIPTIYRDAKTAARQYQEVKTKCMQAFIEQNLGEWIQVPCEVDLFEV